jgi:hypothetical protein
VLDGQLRPHFVNHGVATRDLLRQQLLAVSGGQ